YLDSRGRHRNASPEGLETGVRVDPDGAPIDGRRGNAKLWVDAHVAPLRRSPDRQAFRDGIAAAEAVLSVGSRRVISEVDEPALSALIVRCDPKVFRPVARLHFEGAVGFGNVGVREPAGEALLSEFVSEPARDGGRSGTSLKEVGDSCPQGDSGRDEEKRREPS